MNPYDEQEESEQHEDFVDHAAVTLMPLAIQLTMKPGLAVGATQGQMNIDPNIAAAIAYQLADGLAAVRNHRRKALAEAKA